MRDEGRYCGRGGRSVCVCGWLEKDGEHEVRTLWTSCEADISTLPFYDGFFFKRGEATCGFSTPSLMSKHFR